MAIKDYNAQTDSFNTDIKKYIDNSDGAFTQGAAVADLNQNISAAYVEAEVQAISDKVDELLASLRAGGFIAP